MSLVFHIAEAADWEAAQATGEYRRSTRGRSLDEVGFVHCSHRHQVERIANRAYRDSDRLVLLTIDPERAGADWREESADGPETFPHLYGPVPLDAVVSVDALEPSAGSLFVPLRSWLSPKLVVRPSPIHGLGLFAIAPIATGEPVIVMGGRVLDDAAFSRSMATFGRWSAAAIDDGLNLVQDDDDPVARGNHSCEPNLWMIDELTLAALRAIQPGEETTSDYGMMTVNDAWHMDCRCGTARCRGTISGSDWKRADLQDRYQGHFAPFINRRMASDRTPQGGSTGP